MSEQVLIATLGSDPQIVTLALDLLRAVTRREPLISESKVREVVEQADVIEEYPDDPRGASALMGTQTSLRSLRPCSLLAKVGLLGYHNSVCSRSLRME